MFNPYCNGYPVTENTTYGDESVLFSLPSHAPFLFSTSLSLSVVVRSCRVTSCVPCRFVSGCRGAKKSNGHRVCPL